jgi:hypothetical protein
MPSHPKVWLQPVGGVSTEASQAINRSIPGDQQKHPRRSTEASQARRVLDSPCGGLLGQVQLQQRQGTTAWRQQGSSTQAVPSLMGFTRQQAGPPGKGFKPKVKFTNQASMHHGISSMLSANIRRKCQLFAPRGAPGHAQLPSGPQPAHLLGPGIALALLSRLQGRLWHRLPCQPWRRCCWWGMWCCCPADVPVMLH